MLSDYGLVDEFAGVLAAVVLRHAPGAPVVHLTHGVTPFSVRAGALALERAAPHLGPGVVVAVVDPGVGTTRRAVAVAVAGTGAGPRYLVGPDNGLLAPALALLGGAEGAVELDRPAAPGGPTFDGRDVFAPAAGRLWAGEPLTSLGRPVDPASLAELPAPRCVVRPGAVVAEVRWIDRFGNVQLAARPEEVGAAGLGGPGGRLWLEGWHEKASSRPDEVSGRWLRHVRAFADLEPGEPGLLADANGYLAVVVGRGHAADALGLCEGDDVALGDGGDR